MTSTGHERGDGPARRHDAWKMRKVPGARLELGLALLCLVAASGCALSDRVYETLTVHPPTRGVDVNHASRDELTRLPGMETEDADRIIGARPYEAKSDLVRRGVVSEKQYEELQAHIYVGRVAAGTEAAVDVARHAGRVPDVGD